jgi:outer membrane protein OmpA-like peptidoglycan-associated protein
MPRGPVSRPIPVPIQFVYRTSTFTQAGEKAAHLLLEYLKVGNFREIALTGHADERGSHSLNRELSRERLGTVRDYLRAGGFTGGMILKPLGETKPFEGIDRSKFSRAELYQLDRRVELHLIR